MPTNTSNYNTLSEELQKLRATYGRERAFIAQRILNHPKIKVIGISLEELASFFATSREALFHLISKYPLPPLAESVKLETANTDSDSGGSVGKKAERKND
jgi:hypothetical protein